MIPFEPSIALVVFDLDGTLVDTRRDLADSANALIREYGGAALDDEVVGRLVGQGVHIWVPLALAAGGISACPPDAIERFVELYHERLLDHTTAYDGIPEALQRASGAATLAVLTNKTRRASLAILEGLGLARYFACVEGVDGPHQPKPSPEGLVAIMARAGARPRETVLVGDSPVDLRTARNASVRICVARYGFGSCAAFSVSRD